MHAFLIIAHNEFGLLEKLVQALDHPENDIFIHIDKKVKDFDFDFFEKSVKESKIRFASRVNVKWGDFSMVKAELNLLETALSTGVNYDYVHLISGVDIPLVNQEVMHRFFDENSKKEFIHFGAEKLRDIEVNRVKYYHFATGRRNYFNRFFTKITPIIQGVVGINRIKGLDVQRGSQWFSITEDFARYLYGKKEWIEKQFSKTFIPDEFFVQTVFINSPFTDNLYHKEFDNSLLACMRYCDWKRGAPYTFRNEDYDELVNCGCLFARKFSTSVDSEIIERLYSRIK